METADVLKYAAIVAGYLLALARLNDKARPFWQFLPTWAQPVLPALVVILPDLANGLQKGVSVEDVLGSLVTAGGALMIALRGAVPAAHFAKLSPAAKDEIAMVRDRRNDLTPPPDDDLPTTPKTGAGAAPIIGLMLAVTLALSGALPACSPAATPEVKQPTLEELEKMCPGAARAMTLDCPALAIAKCGDAPSLDECDARAEVEAECDQLIDKEIAKCN